MSLIVLPSRPQSSFGWQLGVGGRASDSRSPEGGGHRLGLPLTQLGRTVTNGSQQMPGRQDRASVVTLASEDRSWPGVAMRSASLGLLPRVTRSVPRWWRWLHSLPTVGPDQAGVVNHSLSLGKVGGTQCHRPSAGPFLRREEDGTPRQAHDLMTLFPAPHRAGLHTALGGAVGGAGCPGSLSSDPGHCCVGTVSGWGRSACADRWCFMAQGLRYVRF